MGTAIIVIGAAICGIGMGGIVAVYIIFGTLFATFKTMFEGR